MQVYRITHAKWAESITGSGHAGRWNKKGSYVCYTAESRALACLENLVHRSGEGFNANFRIVIIELPDHLSVQKIRLADLPDDWCTAEKLSLTQRLGDEWLKKGKYAALNIPSSIISEESNYILNPAHPEFKKIKVGGIYPFKFDGRLL